VNRVNVLGGWFNKKRGQWASPNRRGRKNGTPVRGKTKRVGIEGKTGLGVGGRLLGEGPTWVVGVVGWGGGGRRGAVSLF